MTDDDSRPDPRLSAMPNVFPSGPARPEPLRAPPVERVPRQASGGAAFYVMATLMLVLVLAAGALFYDRMGPRWLEAHWPFDQAQQQDQRP